MNIIHANSFISNNMVEREEDHFLGSVFLTPSVLDFLNLKSSQIEEEDNEDIDTSHYYDHEEYLFI